MRYQDLSLLMIFDAIMTEKSITRAANRLAMTQPAVSNAVSRMRVAWKDEVFTKDGRNIQPTIYAQNLWAQIKNPIRDLSDAVDPDDFDPATAQRTFRIAVSDIVVDMIWLKMRKLIESEAPGINLHAIPYTIVNTEQVLHDAEVDMVVGAYSTVPSVIRSEHLFSPCYLCVMRPGHPLAKENLSLEEFAAADHLLVSLSGDTHGFTDEVLAAQKMTRRIAITVNHFAAIPSIVGNSDLIAIVPSTAVVKPVIEGQLVATKPPVDIPPTQVALMWHKRQERDGGLHWLKQHTYDFITETHNQQMQQIQGFLCKDGNC